MPSIRKTGQYQLPCKNNGNGSITTLKEMAGELDAAIHIAEMVGYEGNQKILYAEKLLKNYHKLEEGPIALLGVSLVSEEQERRYTPSDLAKLAGLKSANAVNKELEKKGFQISERDHKKRLCWKLTEKAICENYGVYCDTGKKRSNGTPVQQIQWYEKTLEVLK